MDENGRSSQKERCAAKTAAEPTVIRFWVTLNLVGLDGSRVEVTDICDCGYVPFQHTPSAAAPFEERGRDFERQRAYSSRCA